MIKKLIVSKSCCNQTSWNIRKKGCWWVSCLLLWEIEKWRILTPNM